MQHVVKMPRQIVSSLRESWRFFLPVLAWYVVFVGAGLIPVDVLVDGVRAFLLAGAVYMVYRVLVGVEDETTARIREEHREHEDDAQRLEDQADRAIALSERYEKAGDAERALEWGIWGQVLATRVMDSHTENIRRIRMHMEDSRRVRILTFVAMVSLLLGLLAVFGISFG